LRLVMNRIIKAFEDLLFGIKLRIGSKVRYSYVLNSAGNGFGLLKIKMRKLRNYEKEF